MNVLNYIDGEMRAAQAGAVLDNVNPATGEGFGRCGRCDGL
jgi:acyl-CoA reductase-like NAD-dependent aldehyde dehydrogenase